MTRFQTSKAGRRQHRGLRPKNISTSLWITNRDGSVKFFAGRVSDFSLSDLELDIDPWLDVVDRSETMLKLRELELADTGRKHAPVSFTLPDFYRLMGERS